jgi:hypothetical protein
MDRSRGSAFDMHGTDEKLINKTGGKFYRLEYLGVD